MIGFILGYGAIGAKHTGTIGAVLAFARMGAQVHKDRYRTEFIPDLEQRLGGNVIRRAMYTTVSRIAIFRGVDVVELGIFALSFALACCS